MLSKATSVPTVSRPSNTQLCAEAENREVDEPDTAIGGAFHERSKEVEPEGRRAPATVELIAPNLQRAIP
jgi:hypothetical protein